MWLFRRTKKVKTVAPLRLYRDYVQSLTCPYDVMALIAALDGRVEPQFNRIEFWLDTAYEYKSPFTDRLLKAQLEKTLNSVNTPLEIPFRN